MQRTNGGAGPARAKPRGRNDLQVSRRALLSSLTGIGAAILSPAPLMAQSERFPSRPIRVLFPYSAGGAPDVALRRICQKVEQMTGATLIVENRTGAGGTVAALAAKQAPPDGYTLVQGDHATHAANLALIKNLAYDPLKDFQPITLFYLSRLLLLVPASLGVGSMKELHALAKSKPGGLSYASQGVGSGGHLAGSMLARAFGTPLTHVPYRGGAVVRTDLLGGRVDMIFNNYGSFRGDVEAGTVKALAIASRERLAAAPDVPTMAEAGYPSVELETWFGLFAPAGVDPQTVQTLNKIFTEAVKTPEVSDFMTSQGFTPKPTTPGEFAEHVKKDIVRLGQLVRDAGAEAR